MAEGILQGDCRQQRDDVARSGGVLWSGSPSKRADRWAVRSIEWRSHEEESHLHHLESIFAIVELGRLTAQIGITSGWVGEKWTSRDVLEGLL